MIQEHHAERMQNWFQYDTGGFLDSEYEYSEDEIIEAAVEGLFLDKNSDDFNEFSSEEFEDYLDEARSFALGCAEHYGYIT